MQISLERQELLQLHPISQSGTLKLLPVGKSKKQKLVIADDSGGLSCFEFKKGEPQVIFQTKPFENNLITSVALGGDKEKPDKIFVSHGQKVMGLTKKGKEFFKLTSSLTESISTLIVEETQIWTSCEYIFNRYDNGQDSAFYMSHDKINCIVIGKLSRDNDYNTILGCKDNCVRILQGSNLFLEIPTVASVTAIAILNNNCIIPNNNNITSASPSIHIVIGLETGTVVLIQVHKNGEYQFKWTYHDNNNNSGEHDENGIGNNSSAVTTLKVFELMKKGQEEIIVGREDGRIEVMSSSSSSSSDSTISKNHAADDDDEDEYDRIINDNNKNNNNFSFPNQQQQLVLFCMNIGETIRAIDCGIVNTIGYNEIIVALHSGRIISLTTEPVNQRSQDDVYGRSINTLNNENRMRALKKEVDVLRIQVDKENDKLKKLQPKSSSSSSSPLASVTAAAPEIQASNKWVLDKEKGAYVLTVDLQNNGTCIDMVMVRSPIKLEVLESESSSSSSTAVLSICPFYLLNDLSTLNGNNNSNSSNNNTMNANQQTKFAVVLRCQSAEKRVTLVLRSTEGHAGELAVTVIADTRPKAAKMFKVELKPLSLHVKISDWTESESIASRCRLRLVSKSITLSLALDWISQLFPDVSTRLEQYYNTNISNNSKDSDDGSGSSGTNNAMKPIQLRFRQCFTNAITFCEFQKNEIIIESQNPAVISIAKETLTNLANYRRIQLEESFTGSNETITSFLSLIWERLSHQQRLTRTSELLEGIMEISMMTENGTNDNGDDENGALSWLIDEYKAILKDQEQIRMDFKNRDKSLEFYVQLITELYYHWNKLQGVHTIIMGGIGGDLSLSRLSLSAGSYSNNNNNKLLELKKLIVSKDCTLISLSNFITSNTSSNANSSTSRKF